MSAHWGIPYPARATGSKAEIGVAFAEVYRMLATCISVFTSLPIESLDRLAHRDLNRIGAVERPDRRTRSAA